MIRDGVGSLKRLLVEAAALERGGWVLMTTVVSVTVPDGVYEGNEFVLEYEGQQLTVTCPGGCGPGSDIDLEVPVGKGSGSGDPTGSPTSVLPNLVDVTVPDGCFEGMEFTVEYDGQSFNIVVPAGVNPGEAITIEVPAPEVAASPMKSLKTPPKPPSERKPPKPKENAPPPYDPPPVREKCSAKKYLSGMDIPSFKGPRKGVTANSVNANAKWMSAGDLFSAIPTEGLGREAGEFYIGQVVQVTRTNGKWTYGKIMDYDPTGDNYTVMTKAGPKYMVDRDDITDDVYINPADGSCAQQ